MKDMEFILNSFTAYMIENDLDEYTPDLGERFVEYCEVDLRVCHSRVTAPSTWRTLTAKMLIVPVPH